MAAPRSTPPTPPASDAARQRAYRARRHLKAGTGDYALTDKIVIDLGEPPVTKKPARQKKARRKRKAVS